MTFLHPSPLRCSRTIPNSLTPWISPLTVCQKRIKLLPKCFQGKYLVTACDDDAVCIYDCEKGERSKMLYSKKYGVDHIKFVHSGAYSAVCASRNDFDCMFA